MLLDSADCRGDVFKSLTLGVGPLAGTHAAFPGRSGMRKLRTPDAEVLRGPPYDCCLSGEVAPGWAPPQPGGDWGVAGASNGLGAVAFRRGLVARPAVKIPVPGGPGALAEHAEGLVPRTPTPGGAIGEHALLLEVMALDGCTLTALATDAEGLASAAVPLATHSGDTAAEGDGELV